MSSLRKGKIRRRRAERLWALAVCGALGGCLMLAGGIQIASGPGFPIMRSAAKPATPAVRGPLLAYTLDEDEDVRTGSILITPRRGDRCQRSLFDNYTGLIWPAGFVSCEAALTKSNEKLPSTPERLQIIGGAFRSAR